MSVNSYRPHVLILPEDRANSELANGFLLHPNLNARLIQVLPFARGWGKVVQQFAEDFAPTMRQYPNRIIVLLIDFGDDENRLDYVKQKIPADLQDRVFVLGVLSEPEKLKRLLNKSFEEIGEVLATDCSDNNEEFWSHELLEHNKIELNRMIGTVKPLLFKA
jgi:hypothetical protein